MTEDVPATHDALRDALIAQREYTLALYAELPSALWDCARVPYMAHINPPLWELAHIAYFAEFFCLRWHADDPTARRVPSIMAEADGLFNSNWVPHKDRWTNRYPSKETCLAYMNAVLKMVLDAIPSTASTDSADASRFSLFQLVLLHEDMHAEALAMALAALDLPLPLSARQCLKRQYSRGVSEGMRFDSGEFNLSESTRAFKFDNEMPARPTHVGAFEIDVLPVSQRQFDGWKAGASLPHFAFHEDDVPAMHVTRTEAAAYAAAHGRRLPTEAEWEFASRTNEAFHASTGDVWEWTASAFDSHPGFVAGAYAEYSAPWFPTSSVIHYVLKGGSFASHPRMKYPQYRNFYEPHRRDVFCGFRTCRTV
jgi:gamma-glutamyl hercynylcysteine S-oxide synthase